MIRLILLLSLALLVNGYAETLNLNALTSPVLFRGNATTAYRDPAVLYDNGTFWLIISYVTIDPNKKAYDQLAWTKSQDLIHWTPVVPFTPKDQHLNYSSPGNIVRFGGQWVLCAQTYPRPNGERFGNADSRLWLFRSADLGHWSEPELLHVKGPNVPREKMGRMIDPFLI